MGEQPHRSIGEVLALVQEEFPDVTISKIRFLESQGLLEPERTPSGYRKFYPADVERLQWILIQQRDNFLPLKVIRDRLDEWDATGTAPEGVSSQPVPSTEATAPAEEAPVNDDDDARAEERRAAASLAAASAQEVAADRTPPPADVDAAPEPAAVEGREESEQESADGELHVGPDDTALTAGELAALAGVTDAVVRELENFSMIDSHRVGPETYYDPKHLAIVQAARVFLEHGIEVRHMRMYKIAAEREAGVFEQLVMPLLKQRNPDARARAVRLVGSLATVGEDLHRALLRQALERTLP